MMYYYITLHLILTVEGHMMIDKYNTSTQETLAEEPWAQGQPVLNSEYAFEN